MAKAKVIAELLGGTYAERMARAAEQGYVTDFLHGSPTLRESGAIDINYPNRTDAGYLGKAFYGTGPDNRFIAKAYAGNTGTVLDLKTNANRFKDFTYDENYRANIEEFGRSIGVETPMTSEDWPTIFAAKMQEAGYDGARGLADDGSVVELAIYDPSKVRSINADFNPANASSSDLLAGIQSAAPIGAGALLAGAALAPEDAEAGVITRGGRRLIESWHGSPHAFPAERLVRMPDGSQQYVVGGVDALPDVPHGAEVIEDFPLGRFRMDKIGTGEGAQAYGHGLYSADNPIVSEDYRRRLQILSEAEQRIYKETIDALKSGAELTPESRNLVEAAQSDFQFFEKRNAASDEIINYLSDGLNAGRGALYRTHIDVDPDTLLDYDAPISEQPEVVESVLRDMWRRAGKSFPQLDLNGNPIAGQVLHSYTDHRGGNRAGVSEELAAAGIPGIRYRDQMSRGDTAEPTFNYVMFDDKPISIVERGNASPEALAATAAATATAVALNNFQSRRASKRDYWRQMRAEVFGFMNDIANGAFAALDKPLQGYMGLAGVAGTLAAGGTLPQALQQGARIAAQPSEATAYQYGGAMTDALAPYSPQGAAIAGALTNAGIQLTSPF